MTERPALGVVHGLEAVDARWRDGVLAIGNFDGVHLGHQAILRRCRQRADALGAAVVAMTFDPHPVAILAPDRAPPLLTPTPEKVERLLAAGADGVVVVHVDRAFLSATPEDFIRLIAGRLSPRVIVEGPDFRFGRGRSGSIETLRSLSAAAHFEVESVEGTALSPTETGETLPISSSAVRGFLAAGQVEAAAACLGRPYVIRGVVAPGAGQGRMLGYPTINLERIEQQIPAEGVYAGRAELGPLRSAAAISIGQRETFGEGPCVVEAFLLDAQGEWYGQTVRLEVARWLREQRRFESAAALAEQIGRDVAAVRTAPGERR